jgi:hypothetical protein
MVRLVSDPADRRVLADRGRAIARRGAVIAAALTVIAVLIP